MHGSRSLRERRRPRPGVSMMSRPRAGKSPGRRRNVTTVAPLLKKRESPIKRCSAHKRSFKSTARCSGVVLHAADRFRVAPVRTSSILYDADAGANQATIRRKGVLEYAWDGENS